MPLVPRLLNLDGTELSWAELNAMVADYYQTAAHTAYYDAPARACGYCAQMRHSLCSGRMAREEGRFSPHDTIPCGCDCHRLDRFV